MSKRAREDDSISVPDSISTTEAQAGSPAGNVNESSGGGGNGGSRGGNHIFPPMRPMKLENKWTKHYTKHFYVKIYANDWIPYTSGTNKNIIGFMTVIPWQALCMYLSPNEYLDIVRNNAYAKIGKSDFQLEFKAVRTPFDTNSSDQSEANGNLQFEIQRWDGLEKMLPFETIDIEGVTPPGTTPTVIRNSSYIELINRLYGLAFTNGQDYKKLPATMRERGLSYRPNWKFNVNALPTSYGDLYRNINPFISSLPIGEYVTDVLNTNEAKMGPGYCFNRPYEAKNGILAMASSAYDNSNSQPPGYTQINIKERMVDNSTAPTTNIDCQYTTNWNTTTNAVTGILSTQSADVVNPDAWGSTSAYTCTIGQEDPRVWTGTIQIPANYIGNSCNPTIATAAPNLNIQTEQTAAVQLTPRQVFNNNATIPVIQTISTAQYPVTAGVNDCVGYGYENSLAYYTTANLENYQAFTSNNERPLHHMPSMMIGAVPKTNKDDTYVNATLEFEIRTSIEIHCSDVHPTYMNMAIDTLGEAGAPGNFVDPQFALHISPISNVYGGKWFHNEKDVLLSERKNWHLNYGRAAKPLFNNLPDNVPNLK